MHKYCMRSKELKPLFEVNMSPAALRATASQVQALAGMEFELVIPNFGVPDDMSDEMEPDYSNDPVAESIDQIIDFFSESETGTGFQGPREAARARSKLTQEWDEFRNDHLDSEWNDSGEDYHLKYMKENVWRNEKEKYVAATLRTYGLSNAEIEDLFDDDGSPVLQKAAKQAYADFLEEVEISWEDQDEYYEEAKEDFTESEWDEPDESEWLGNQTMSEIAANYDLPWPHYSTMNLDFEDRLSELADDFSRIVGKPVNYSTDYHKGERRPGYYTIEPDGSIKPKKSTDGGLEFISPPMPLQNMLEDLRRVVEWAHTHYLYTNDSTGLHMNVSIPNFSLDNLDYVKLVLFLGDEYVLKQFDRLANSYARSALALLKDRAEYNQMTTQDILYQMRGKLDLVVTRLLFGVQTDKYTSVNIHDDYVEFRSPGGDWLNEDLAKLENTLLRFVVALDIACDPNKYKKEYAKKLYKLLAPGAPNDLDAIQTFSNWSAGLISHENLMYLLRTRRERVSSHERMMQHIRAEEQRARQYADRLAQQDADDDLENRLTQGIDQAL